MVKRIFWSLFFITLLICNPIHSSQNNLDYIPKACRHAIKPYLIPANHPAKPILDHIFMSSRATLNYIAFREAGFETFWSGNRSFILVARHPLLPGYLVKVQLDDELRTKHHVPGWQWFVKRCIGAKKMAKAIHKVKSKYFSVPKKWIYPLPAFTGLENPGYDFKPIILIVEDMHLVSEEENLIGWKSKITKSHLDELITIVSMAGGASYRPDNIALTINGTFAFIDTEYPNSTPNLMTLLPYLSPEMQTYWNFLLKYQP